jgi:hypothetical protein
MEEAGRAGRVHLGTSASPTPAPELSLRGMRSDQPLSSAVNAQPGEGEQAACS